MRVLLKIPLSPFTGYGNDGIGMVRAFLRRGDDVYLQPTNLDAPLPPEVAALLTKPLQAPFDLFINHVDPGQLSSNEELQRSAKVSIAWTMWEYDSYQNADKKSRKSLRKRLKHFDAFVGYSSLDMDSFRPYYDGPMFVRQGGFDPSDWPLFVDREWDSKEFRFGMIGVLSERKDPFVAIEAFRLAKAMDPEFDRWARLSLKTTAPGLHHKIEDAFRQVDPATGEEYTSLRIFYDIWPQDIVREFYRVQHVLLSPSRGEGKNMPALEFMSSGGTVIATNWAGHQEWLDEAYAYPLNYTLALASQEANGAMNARADAEHLAQLMVHTFQNRDEVRRKGEIASQRIPAERSWDFVLEDLLNKILDHLPEKAALLSDVSTSQETRTPTTVELRCPRGPRHLLAKTVLSGERAHVTKDNLIELACDECKRSLRKQGKTVTYVLHRYNLVGVLVESVVT